MRVLFIDTVHPVLNEKLSQNGHECVDGTQLNSDEIDAIISSFDGIVIRSKFPVDKSFIDRAMQLKFIARSGAGLENIDLDYCQKKNIVCFNSPEGNKDAVGEHMMGMLLCLFNNLASVQNDIANGKWEREANRGIELMGKTVGIIGYGNNGSAFAKKLSGFDCTILAYDKYKEDYANAYVKESHLEYLQEHSDIISFHVPLTPETEYYFSHDFLNKMNKPFYLLNGCRGKVVNTQSLVAGLKSRKILGACLDVIEYEKSSFEDFMSHEAPDEFHYLVESKNVILSPHVAGWTKESYVKLSEVLWKKINNWMALSI